MRIERIEERINNEHFSRRQKIMNDITFICLKIVVIMKAKNVISFHRWEVRVEVAIVFSYFNGNTVGPSC